MDDKTIKEITAIKKTYCKADAEKRDEDKKLMAIIEKYLGKNGGRNKTRFDEVMQFLMPVNYGSHTFIDLMNTKIYLKGKHKKTDTPLSEKAKAEIKAQIEAFSEKLKLFEIEEEKLKKFVNDYVNENGAYEDEQKLNELIDLMPASTMRFWLLDLKFDLKEGQ